MAKLATPVISVSGTNIIWDSVDFADEYGIYVNSSNVDYTIGLYYSIGSYGFENGDIISVKAEAHGTYTESDMSNTLLYAGSLEAPSIYAGTTYLSWDTIAGADEYFVYLDSFVQTTTTSTQISFSSLSPSTGDKLNVKAKNNNFGVYSDFSNSLYYNITKPSAPSISLSELTVSWSRVTDATNYKVYKNENLATSIYDYQSSTISYTFSDLLYGDKIKVECYNYLYPELISDFSNIVTYITLNAPIISISDKRISWTAINGASKYEIYKNGTYVTETTNSYYEFASLANGDKIKVKSVNSGGDKSIFSNEITYTTSTTNTIIIRRRLII